MDQAASWYLTQGVLGVTCVVLVGALIWVVRKWDQCRTENAQLQKDHGAAVLALQERSLTVLMATNSQIADNTKTMEMMLKRIPS